MPNYRIVQTQISVGAHKAAHVKPLWWEKCNSHRYIFGSLTELMWDLFSRRIFRYTWMQEASGLIKSFCVPILWISTCLKKYLWLFGEIEIIKFPTKGQFPVASFVKSMKKWCRDPNLGWKAQHPTCCTPSMLWSQVSQHGLCRWCCSSFFFFTDKSVFGWICITCAVCGREYELCPGLRDTKYFKVFVCKFVFLLLSVYCWEY